jgi:iron complex transport system permease protein
MTLFRRMSVTAPLLLAVLGALVLLSLGSGSVAISPGRVAALLFDPAGAGAGEGVDAVIIRDIRLPRVLLAALVGGALALSGVVMQGLFQNPMADPYVVGISAGAALGATLSLSLAMNFWFLGLNSISLFAFAGALAASFLVYGISVRGGRLPVTVVLLTGVGIGSLATALSSFLMLTTQSDLHRVLYWLLGSLGSRRWEHVQMLWPQTLAGALLLQAFARDLNLILLGEEEAHHLGVEVERLKRFLLVVSSLLTASAVAVSGIVGFVGLVVPHVMRLLVGPDHRRLFPASLLGGAVLLVAADLLARTVIAPAEVPLGIITAFLGCPFFLYLLNRRPEVGA